jgi:uncharacterized iron-regulated protein
MPSSPLDAILSPLIENERYACYTVFHHSAIYQLLEHRNVKLKFPYLALLACALTSLAANAQTPHPPVATYVPERVYQSDSKKFSDFEAMLAELARAEIVFVGEQHDDPNTHRLERAILEGLQRRRRPVTVALEMFERDTQSFVNEYLAGNISEEGFLKISRPWGNYATDYRPLIEIAKAHQWRVIAGNVPRRLAAQVSKTGLPALESLSADDRKYAAAEHQCPMDDYFKRFAEAMTAHPSDNDKQQKPADTPEAKKKAEEEAAKMKAMTERFYAAQCVKDETMAESITRAYQETPANNLTSKPIIVHFNGAFHSDYRLGTAARTQRRLPKTNIKVVSIVPLEELDSIKPEEYRKRGDYIVFTTKTPKADKAATN